MSDLGAKATPRPWHTIGGGHAIDDAAGQVVICGSWNEYGCGYLPNAAFIVYAVNRIEEAERLLREAERLLEEGAPRMALGDASASKWYEARLAFLETCREQDA